MLAATAPTVPAVSGTTCSPKASLVACIGSNGSCRRKVTDLSLHLADKLDAVAHVLNTRPRKTFGWKTPVEVLDQFLVKQYEASVATTG